MSDRCDAGHKRTMRLNEDTVLVGRRCVLVPYKEKYVKRYHAWMQDDDLLALTASERLTLDEEVENQKSWRDDAKKLTFIVLDRAQCFKGDDRFPTNAMVGDVNAFLTVPDEPLAAEVDVMVPERRRRGFGGEAVRLLLRYGREALHLETFVAKIASKNAASLKLFAALGFERTNYVEAFDEVELRSTSIINVPWTVQSFETAPAPGFEERRFSVRDEDDANVSGLVVRFGAKSAFAWVGPADNAPALGALAGAAPRAFAQGGAATNLIDPADVVGPQVAARLAAATDRLVLVAWSLDRASAAVERALAERVPPAGCGFCAGLARATAAAAALFGGSSSDDDGVAPPPPPPAPPPEPLPAPVPSAVGCARLAAFAPGYAPRYAHPALRLVSAPATGGGRGLAAARDLDAGTLLLLEAPLLSREAQATIADPAAALPSLSIEQLHGATLEEKWQFNAFESGLYRLRSLLNDSPQPSCVALTTAGGLAEVWTQRKVEAGAPLTVSYVQPECSVARRDTYLRAQHGFVSDRAEADAAAEALDGVDDLLEAGDVAAALAAALPRAASSRRAAGLAAAAAGRAARERLVLPRATLGARGTPHGLALFHALAWRDALARVEIKFYGAFA